MLNNNSYNYLLFMKFLGAIVDILGVPSSASHLWDNARR